jgi:hypothetical protein
MNSIEKAYSKMKAFLRKIAERTVAGLLAALDACADIFNEPNAKIISAPADMIQMAKSIQLDRP